MCPVSSMEPETRPEYISNFSEEKPHWVWCFMSERSLLTLSRGLVRTTLLDSSRGACLGSWRAQTSGHHLQTRTLKLSLGDLFFLKILFFPFSPQSPLVHSCIFFVVCPSSCSMWDSASAWFDEQSAPRIRTNETLGRLQRSMQT